MNTTKRYRELKKLKTFHERYAYLKLSARVGATVFGFDRWLNQVFYSTQRWKSTRDEVIVRDWGCDLGIEGYDIYDRILVHHMTPLTPEDIELDKPIIYDPEFLICTSFNTHNAIHYGDERLLPRAPIERIRNDTCLWR